MPALMTRLRAFLGSAPRRTGTRFSVRRNWRFSSSENSMGREEARSERSLAEVRGSSCLSRSVSAIRQVVVAESRHCLIYLFRGVFTEFFLWKPFFIGNWAGVATKNLVN